MANDPRARHAKVVAAGYAVASWARARRSTWTDAPLHAVAPAVPIPAPVIEPIVALEPVEVHVPVLAEPVVPEVVVPPEPAGPSFGERAMDAIREATPAIRQWAPRAIAAAVLLAAVGYGVQYVRSLPPRPKREPKPAQAAGGTAPVAPKKTTGSLNVASTPAGAQVIVDGTPRGVTPIKLDDLSAGKHAIELQSSKGVVHRSVTIAAGETAELDESIYSGWLTVLAPFDVSIADGSRSLTLDDRNQIMLPPGRHDLRLTNRALEYDEVRRVELKPGEMATLRIEPPRSTITVTTSEPAEVWVDGTRVGDAPLTEAPMAVGTHDLVVKRANGREKRIQIRVTVKPFSINVDLAQDR